MYRENIPQFGAQLETYKAVPKPRAFILKKNHHGGYSS
jgi:hypothetical protein